MALEPSNPIGDLRKGPSKTFEATLGQSVNQEVSCEWGVAEYHFIILDLLASCLWHPFEFISYIVYFQRRWVWTCLRAQQWLSSIVELANMQGLMGILVKSTQFYQTGLVKLTVCCHPGGGFSGVAEYPAVTPVAAAACQLSGPHCYWHVTKFGCTNSACFCCICGCGCLCARQFTWTAFRTGRWCHVTTSWFVCTYLLCHPEAVRPLWGAGEKFIVDPGRRCHRL